jgi:hypothetical protein
MQNTNPDTWFKWRLETNLYKGIERGGLGIQTTGNKVEEPRKKEFGRTGSA